MAHSDVDSALLTPCPSVATKLVLVTLAHHRNHKSGKCCPSMACIERETGLHRVTVQKAIKTLIDSQLLEIIGRGKRGLYYYRFRNLVVRPDEFQDDDDMNSSAGLAVSDWQSQATPDAVSGTPDAVSGYTTGSLRLHKQEGTGKEPEEEPTRERVKGSSSPSSEKRTDLDLRRKQINVWFRNPADTAWAPQWMGELMNYASWPEENWEALADFMLAKLPTGAAEDHPLRFRRRKILSLLENLPDELAKALAWRDTQPATRAPAPDPYAAPPCDDWHALADELFQPGCTQGRDWIDLDRDSRRDLHEFFQKKTAA